MSENNWKRSIQIGTALIGRSKKITAKVLYEVVADYDFGKDIQSSREELLGLEEQVPSKGIITLEEMAHLVDKVYKNRIYKLSTYNRSSIYIKDEELRFVDELLDDTIINTLLSYDGYSPAMRDIYARNMFRAELLKAIKYPEISYRKFSTEEYFGLDRKQNRVFIGLSLSRKDMLDHTQLSKFRRNLPMTALAPLQL